MIWGPALFDDENLLIDQEFDKDAGQMLPGGADANWRLSPDVTHLRMQVQTQDGVIAWITN